MRDRDVLVATPCRTVNVYLWIAKDIITLQRKLEDAEARLAAATPANIDRRRREYEGYRHDVERAWEVEADADGAAQLADPRAYAEAALEVREAWADYYTRRTR